MPASTCRALAASMAPSKSPGTRTSIVSAPTLNARAAVSSRFKLRRVEAGNAKDCDTRGVGNNLFEQPKLLPDQLRDIKKHSRNVAARAGKTPDISLRDRIALQIYPDDRNADRGIAGSGERRWSRRENDSHIEPNQIGRSLRSDSGLNRYSVATFFPPRSPTQPCPAGSPHSVAGLPVLRRERRSPASPAAARALRAARRSRRQPAL